MHNAERPVKCHTQSTSAAFLKYAHHPTDNHELYNKSVMMTKKWNPNDTRNLCS